MTASSDKTVKIWNLSPNGRHLAQTNGVVGTLHRSGQFADVHVVRYTPFGKGLVTISHTSLGEDADAPQTLRLWSLTAMTSQVSDELGIEMGELGRVGLG